MNKLRQIAISRLEALSDSISRCHNPNTLKMLNKLKEEETIRYIKNYCPLIEYISMYLNWR